MPFSWSFSRDRAASDPIGDLVKMPAVGAALAIIDRSSSRFTSEQIRICEIPAPPFAEEERGRYFERRFRELGLLNVERDAIGNVTGDYPHQPLSSASSASSVPTGDQHRLVVSAHLDTVFPAGTDVAVRRVGSRLCAPGIGDDAAGLAAMIAMIEIIKEAGIEPVHPLSFVATVGEEGEGDLRGVRHLFTAGRLAGRIGRFISFDGAGSEWVTHQALGSRRYRIRLDGPGGHSWGDYGVVNPVHALGRIVGQLADYPAPATPRTTFNVGRIEGGESVNVIPTSATMDVDLRSGSTTELNRIEEFLISTVNRAVAAENRLRAASGRELGCEIRLIGSRPSGETPESDPLVRNAFAIGNLLGIRTWLNRNSTDSNIPISLGIPAITIGAGGVSGDPHRLTEWYDPRGREIGYRRALLLILSIVGVKEGGRLTG
jgi:tripeptide aminopeptidase